MIKWTREEQKEHRKVWIEALRSGKYGQIKEVLKGNKDGKVGYCCLGVACELMQPDIFKLDNIGYYIENGKITERTLLTNEVREYYGLGSVDGLFGKDGNEFTNERSLTTYNDNGTTFAEIADIIEQEPKGLFEE